MYIFLEITFLKSNSASRKISLLFEKLNLKLKEIKTIKINFKRLHYLFKKKKIS